MLLGVKPADFSIEKNHKLTLASGQLLNDAAQYRRSVRRLIYLTIIRLDLGYVVQILSQFMEAPKEEHMDVALGYYATCKELLGGNPSQDRQNYAIVWFL